MKSCFTRVVAIGALATALSGGVMSSSQALTLPVTPVQGIAGASPAEHVQWRGYGWGGYGWRRPNYGGGGAGRAGAPGPPRVVLNPPPQFPLRLWFLFR